jgi:hypothetical protein
MYISGGEKPCPGEVENVLRAARRPRRRRRRHARTRRWGESGRRGDVPAPGQEIDAAGFIAAARSHAA